MLRQVTFANQNSSFDFSNQSRDELMLKLNLLKQRVEAVEHGIPLLCLKTDDEMVQIKHFITTYYEPILSSLELEQLKLGQLELEQQNVLD